MIRKLRCSICNEEILITERNLQWGQHDGSPDFCGSVKAAHFWTWVGGRTAVDCSFTWVMWLCRVDSPHQKEAERPSMGALEMEKCSGVALFVVCEAAGDEDEEPSLDYLWMFCSSFQTWWAPPSGFCPISQHAALPDMQHQCLTQDFSLLCH